MRGRVAGEARAERGTINAIVRARLANRTEPVVIVAILANALSVAELPIHVGVALCTSCRRISA